MTVDYHCESHFSIAVMACELQCVAVMACVLQCVAVCCSDGLCVAVCCSDGLCHVSKALTALAPKLRIIFHKRAIKYRSLLRKMT